MFTGVVLIVHKNCLSVKPARIVVNVQISYLVNITTFPIDFCHSTNFIWHHWYRLFAVLPVFDKHKHKSFIFDKNVLAITGLLVSKE